MTTEATPPPPPSAGPVPEPAPRAPAFPTTPPRVPPRPKDTSGLATATVVLSLLLAVCFLASSGSAVWLASALTGGGTVDDAPWAPLLTYAAASVLVVPVGLAAWLVTGFWAMNVRSNAELVSPRTLHQRRRGWGLWGWVVPIVSLWFPYQFLRDVRCAAGVGGSDRRLGLWWTGWLVLAIGSRFEASFTDDLLSGEDAGGAVTFFAVLGMAATVVAVVLWVVIVRSVERGLAQRAVAATL